VLKEFTDVKGLLDDLVRIASDGRVNPHEEAEFTAIMRGNGGAGTVDWGVKFFALRQGIEIDELLP